MFKDFKPGFSRLRREFVEKTYFNAQLIVEYGSGGSTFLAAKAKKKVLTVESSIEWLMELMAAYKEKELPGDIVPLWANIGETKEWGYPVDDRHWKNWSNYPMLPWKFCQEHSLFPDVVLIDGRFRVACFIASCVYAQKPTTIIFDDFVKRKKYHCVKKIVEPSEIIDDHMAIFNIQQGMIDTKFLLENFRYFNQPD